MALIKCKECGAQVSSEARACPQCGSPAASSRASYAWLVILPVGGIVVFLAVGFLSSSPEKSKARNTIEYCWKQADATMPGTGARDIATKACKRLVSDYESKFGIAPSLRHE